MLFLPTRVPPRTKSAGTPKEGPGRPPHLVGRPGEVDSPVVGRFAIDVTACWRPRRVGMLTVAVELSKALVARKGRDEFTLLCSRERPAGLEDLDCEAVLSPYRHELALKTRWLPAIEPELEAHAILYP